MKTFRIFSKAGVNLGEYSGYTAEEAVSEMNKDAGYASDEDAIAITGQSNLTDGLKIIDVTNHVTIFLPGSMATEETIHPDSAEETDCAEPTSRCLSGSSDFWAAEEWAAPAKLPDGRKCVKYYLFEKDQIVDANGEKLEAEFYPWTADNVSRIQLLEETEENTK